MPELWGHLNGADAFDAPPRQGGASGSRPLPFGIARGDDHVANRTPVDSGEAQLRTVASDNAGLPRPVA